MISSRTESHQMGAAGLARRLGLALLLAFAAMVFMDLPAAAKARPKPQVEIKFATLAPDGSTWMKIARALDDSLRAATDNRLGFKFYPGGVQGDEKDVLRKMRIGQIHAGGFTGFGLGAVAPEFRVLEVPFMFRNLDEVDFVRDKLNANFARLFEKKGFVLLGWADVGFIYIYSNTPITTPDDLQRVRMWTWSGDPLAELFFRAFHVSPIPLALPDVLTSLQMGVIDAVYAPPLACLALQWFTRVRYVSNVPVTYGFGALLVTKQALSDVSAADLGVLKRLSRRASEELIGKTRVQNVEAIGTMRKEGVALVSVGEAEMNVFFTTGRSAWADGVDKLYPRELLDQVSSLLREYRNNREEDEQSP